MTSYVGDAIAQVKNLRNTKIDTNYGETLERIQQTAQSAVTQGGDIEKGFGTAFGAVAGAKGVYDTFKKYKDKLKNAKDALKKKKKDDEDDDNDEDDDATGNENATSDPASGDVETNATTADADVPELDPDVANQVLDETFGTSNETPVPELSQEDAQNALDELFGGDSEEATTSISDLIKGGIQDGRAFLNKVFNRGQEVIDNYANEPTVSSTELPQQTVDVPDNELGGGRMTTNEPYGNGEGDIEMTGDVTETPYFTDTPQGRQAENLQEMQDEWGVGEMDTIPEEDEEDEDAYDEPEDMNPDEIEDPVSNIENAGDEIGSALEDATNATSDAIGNATSSLTEGLNSAVSGASDAVTTAVGEGADIVASTAEEAVGTALDATPLAPIGLILNILGLVGAGAGVVAGAVESGNAENTETTQENQAEEDRDNQKAQPADFAGTVAGRASSALSKFM
jgi:hypothetical protein